MRIPIAALTALMLAGPVVQAGTSNSLLDVSPDGNRLLVANTDNGTVRVVDTADRKSVREIAVGRQPEGVSWIGAGPLAAVTLYFEDKVALIDADNSGPGRPVRRGRQPGRPAGLGHARSPGVRERN
jgi:YVTN family beta-propeller protein